MVNTCLPKLKDIVIDFRFSVECLALAGEVIPESTSGSEENTSNLRNVMRSRAVHLLALFILIYVGVEVTIGGLSKLRIFFEAPADKNFRLDCHFCHRTTPWWPFVRLYLFRVLWRYADTLH